MTEPESTSSHAARPDEVVLETAQPGPYAHTYDGYLVQAHDVHGRLLWDAQGRPVLVPQGRQGPRHPLDRTVNLILLLVALLLIVVCIIGGIGLHDLDQLRNGF